MDGCRAGSRWGGAAGLVSVSSVEILSPAAWQVFSVKKASLHAGDIFLEILPGNALNLLFWNWR